MFTKENVVTARYSNNADLVKVEWKDEDDVVREYSLFEDNNDPAWKSLIESGWTKAKIDEASSEYKNQAANDFNEFAKRLFRENDDTEFKTILDNLFSNEVDDNYRASQNLFTLKLFLFELNEIKRSADKESKVKLRKAKSQREALFIAVDIARETGPEVKTETQDQ